MGLPNWGAKFLGFGDDRIERASCAGKMCRSALRRSLDTPLSIARQRAALFGCLSLQNGKVLCASSMAAKRC
ncbi:hypothetical protein SAMN04488512_10414 [Sulfitobacter litoralis]|uniref:Uncharacterized protein n=1 Tax=Sulfitobacter litoralis TaxID=335975 RepID=A0ABY0RXB9_9RHOB|nr:hypothetical protein SAMN04488512_10414 [Sulfitobacter litoralis]